MASKKTSPGVISKRYVSAYIDMAEDKKCLKKAEEDMASLTSILEVSSDFSGFIKNPIFDENSQMKVIEEISKKYGFDAITLNLLSIVVGNRRLSLLPVIIKEFNNELMSRKGQVKAGIKVANDLTAKQKKSLEDSLTKAVGSKVVAEVQKDESLLGGMVVTVGSIMVDDSVRHKLDRISREMKNSNEKEEVA